MLVEAVGWLGATILLVAYGLVSYGSVSGRSIAYQALNALGGLLLAVNSGWHRAWPSVLVNVIWTAIAVGAMLIGLGPRRSAPREPPPT
jgi:hypothetical protein